MSGHQQDRIFSIGTLCLGGYLAIVSFGYPVKSALFPRALSILLLAMSLILLVKSICRAKQADSQRQSGQSPLGFDVSALHKLFKAPAVLVFGSALAYVGLIKVFGYVLATLVFMVVLMLGLGYRHWIRLTVWAILFTGFLYFIFFHILGIPAPESLFLQ